MDLDLACQAQLYLGLYEKEIAPWLEKLSCGIRTAIDAGAGEGEYTLYFLKKTSACKVLAFDHSASAQKLLSANLKLNDLARDSRLQCFAKRLSSSSSNCSHTLDSLASLTSLPCLIKVDVDGTEVAILRGARNVLRLPQVSWVIETHSKQLEQQCIAILRQAGYRTQIIHNAWWRVFLHELRPIPHNRWLVATTPSFAR